jgi:hypothetical protein
MKMDVYFYVSMNGKYVYFICNKEYKIQKEYNIANHYYLKYTNCCCSSEKIWGVTLNLEALEITKYHQKLSSDSSLHYG